MGENPHADLAEQIRNEIGSLAGALDALLGGGVLTAERVHEQAPLWAAQILSGDDKLAAQTVIDLMNVRWVDGTQPPSAWWGTPLGQAVARSVGHPSAENVSYSVAGSMLGCSKQYVQKLVGACRLTPGPDGGVTVESVRAILAERGPAPSSG